MNKKDNSDLSQNIRGPRMSRRKMLKSLGGLTAGAFASTFLPPNVRKVLANPPKKHGSFKDIEHVVLLMQENRSFDHYFGALSGVRGFDDPDVLKMKNGRSVFYQPDPQNPDGYLLPFHLDTIKTSAQKIPSTSHAWSVQHASWNHGKMNRWIPAHQKVQEKAAPYVMGYYKREDIPFHYALADAFTICDAYHCSVLGPTWPNRMYWFTGTIDPEGKGGGPIINNRAPNGGYRWTTYAERLEKAGVSWKVYQEKDNYGCNMLENFHTFMTADKNSPLYKRGMVRGPLGKFEYDAITDNLPAVSWIIPTSYQSEHPAYTPADGAGFIASKLNAIAANPEVWAKTVFILVYDENDGIFDHVPPIMPKPGTPNEFVKGLPIGSGYRVPCIVVSPWTTGGYVCSDSFDHTSNLQLLEKFTGVKEPNISQWRRDTFGDFTSVFRFDEAKAEPPVIPDTSGLITLMKYETEHLPKPKIPGARQTVPKQEKGTRKRVS
ncbi:MAG TPA: alkaline phosphatase family protein [Balneolales bacterium]|nr:alkaline phosphatase family protein [Balneolales bacterium]